MKPETIKRLFPNASKSTLAANQDSDSTNQDADCAHAVASGPRWSKLEDRFMREILPSVLDGTECVRRQFRVRVSPDDGVVLVHYTADVAIWTPNVRSFDPMEWSCQFWEVKDSRRKPHSDELTRPKLARLMNPWISEIWLATWDGHEWKTRQLA